MASRATFDAVSTISALSPTMMPFLYQTRTLASLSTSARMARSLPRYATLLRREFYGSLRLPERQDGSYSQPHRRTPPSSSQDDIPFESAKATSSGPLGRHRSGSNWERMQLNEFGEVDDGILENREAEHFMEEEDDDQEIGPHSMNLRGPRESTITETERRAFQNIFSEMFSQSQGPAKTDAPPAPDNAKTKLNNILAEAMSSAKLIRASTREEKEIVVSRYPPALRASIAKAIGLTENEDEAESWFEEEQEPELGHDALEALREPERLRVEALMKDADTDAELWDIMEKEVFSLVSKLGLLEDPFFSGPPTKSKSRKSKTQKNQERKPKAKISEEGVARFGKVVVDATTGAEVSALTIYGPLYPSYLLLGIRLLDRSFARPSPLALSVLPKIKSLGAISHVLGASTQLYNEVMRVYFHRYEDFRAISQMLNEMERSAVELDEETLQILYDIMKLRRRVRIGKRGPVLQEMWYVMPQFTTANFRMWVDKITAILLEKGRHKNDVLY
ncbi:hypothetical protein BJ875DRAFT_467096 [Amylocarpus encephaloides]|uniref:Mtf2-like C-terminal domain-containing protein n=1 Tax=Amylocarpus encephaloides TaxID=45428 RepID=A0A9P7YFZ9_9HELO|nr:hypothetical protein BJ875DRAFT_467096 [Amylocarpus encephaloides]